MCGGTRLKEFCIGSFLGIKLSISTDGETPYGIAKRDVSPRESRNRQIVLVNFLSCGANEHLPFQVFLLARCLSDELHLGIIRPIRADTVVDTGAERATSHLISLSVFLLRMMTSVDPPTPKTIS